MTTLRIPEPCGEDLDAMPRTKDGVHCTRCRRDVVDLRRATEKRALAIILELAARDPEGRACVRVRATPDGVPVFAPEPSLASRLALPAALAGSLAACTPDVSCPPPGTAVEVAVGVGEQVGGAPVAASNAHASQAMAPSPDAGSSCGAPPAEPPRPLLRPIGGAVAIHPRPTGTPGEPPAPESRRARDRAR